MDQIRAMDSFVRVVRARSFSQAAREAGLSRALITKHVQVLEARIGARLMNRTTRSLALTEIGAAYYDFCRRILGEIEEEERALRDMQTEPRGSLRVLVPKSFGSLHMGEAVAAFARRYPDIRVTLVMDDASLHAINLVTQGYDIAVRLSDVHDSSLVVRRLATLHWTVCASPDYLARCGTPQSPPDLAAHNCLMHITLGADRQWRFERGRRTVAVKIAGTYTANSVIALRDAARAGVGIALLPTYCAAADLADGTLQPVLGGWCIAERPLYVVYPYGDRPPQKVRLFAAFLAEWFRQPPWEARRPAAAAHALRA